MAFTDTRPAIRISRRRMLSVAAGSVVAVAPQGLGTSAAPGAQSTGQITLPALPASDAIHEIAVAYEQDTYEVAQHLAHDLVRCIVLNGPGDKAPVLGTGTAVVDSAAPVNVPLDLASVRRDTTIADVRALLDGEQDSLPADALYMIGALKGDGRPGSGDLL